MNRLDAMAVFVAVADAGSLSAAGRRLNLPLATVSRKLAELEAHLQARLVVRSTRRLSLTEVGRDFLAASRRILEQLDEAEHAASGAYAEPKGLLVLAAPLAFGRLHVLPLVNGFLAQYPEVDVRLLLGDRNVSLVEAHVDLALRIGELTDSGLVAVPLGQIRLVICASPAYLSAAGVPEVPHDLAAHSCVSFETLMASNAWSFDGASGPYRVPIRSRLAVSTADAAVAAAIAGVGVTRLLSYQVNEALRDGRLVRILGRHEPAAVPVHLVHLGRGLLPMKSRAFLDFATPALRELLLDPQRSPQAPVPDPARPGPASPSPKPTRILD